MGKQCRIFIISAATGKEIEHPFYAPGEFEVWDRGSEFLWTEGNFACDCNRGLFFDGDDHECGDTKFFIRVIDLDGNDLHNDIETALPQSA